jgi:DNA-binding NtrC family response regulator
VTRAQRTAGQDAPASPMTVLLVEDDTISAKTLEAFLRQEGHSAETATTPREAWTAIERAEQAGADFDALILCPGAVSGDTSGFLRDLARRRIAIGAIILADYATVEHAVEALRLGACDYLVKPVVDAELRQSLARAQRHAMLLRENRTLRRRLDDRLAFEHIVADDPRMRRVFEIVRAVAPGRTTVLIEGESGTGKSLIAHAIHHHSPRRDRPFVELSCGSIPETLLESELFGHVKGAFTGAHTDRAGRFVAANTGTIFLDEINSASPAMQLKLLRVLQERRFEPVGGTRTTEVDVRVILASNQPLESLVSEGRFRQDLYYRINVVRIELPPLRERVTDIPRLAGHFLARFSADLHRQIVGFSPDALAALQRYHYPGNVRELQNIVERAAVLARTQTIQVEDLPEEVLAPRRRTAPLTLADDQPWTPMTLDEALREPEKRIILRALEANNWNRRRTSEQLGINRATLYKKMKAHGLLNGQRLAG